MMRHVCELCIIGLLVACSTGKLQLPEEKRVDLNMATVGVENFTDYIHSLDIYSFQLASSGDYVFHKVLGKLDAAAIADLEDVSNRGNAKYYTTSLPVGTYELYFVGNADGSLEAELQTEISRPGDIFLQGNSSGQDSIYFVGKLPLRIVTDFSAPVSVTLKRVVSKLVVFLDGVPPQVTSIRLAVGNIATGYSLDGSTSSQAVTVEKTFPHVAASGDNRDTVIYEMLMFPTVGDASPFSIAFEAENGQIRTKEMPPLKLLPDKYIRVRGTVSDNPGALLSFDIAVSMVIFDSWANETLPDFPIKPDN